MDESLVQPRSQDSHLFFLCVTDTAYGKNKEDGKWYYFDDSSVSSATEDQIVVSYRFILFVF